MMVPENRLQKLLVASVNRSNENLQQIKTNGSHVSKQQQQHAALSLLDEEASPGDMIPRDCIHVLEHHKDEVWHVQFSPDGKYLATCSADKTAQIFEVAKLGEELYSSNKQSNTSQQQQQLQQSSKTTSNSQQQQQQQQYKPTVLTGHTDIVTLVSWSPNSNMLLTCSADKTIKLWTANGTLVHTIDKHKDQVAGIAWMPDGSQFISAGGKNDKSIRRWVC